MSDEEFKYKHSRATIIVAVIDGILTAITLLFQFYVMYVVVRFVGRSRDHYYKYQKWLEEESSFLLQQSINQSVVFSQSDELDEPINATVSENITFERLMDRREYQEEFGPVTLKTGPLFQTLFWSFLMISVISLVVELIGCVKLFRAAGNTRYPDEALVGLKFWWNAMMGYTFFMVIFLICYTAWLQFFIFVSIRCVFLYFVGKFMQELIDLQLKSSTSIEEGGGVRGGGGGAKDGVIYAGTSAKAGI